MPKRIPIAEARRVAEAQNLRQVVLLGFDGERTHVVTYGVTKADCDQAAIAQKWWNGKTGPQMEAARKATEAEIACLRAQLSTTQAALEEARKLSRVDGAVIEQAIEAVFSGSGGPSDELIAAVHAHLLATECGEMAENVVAMYPDRFSAALATDHSGREGDAG